MSFADHFSRIAERYATYRPRYPQALADALAERCTRHELAWDAGCGNGQLSVLLATRFSRVVATDPSQAQLAAAQVHDRVDYRCARAEDAVLEPGTVDLAVAAQAAHWFDWPRYLAEAARVTRPGSLIALVTYAFMQVGGQIDELLGRYIREDVASYWPPGREHIDNGYRELQWPWQDLDPPSIPMTSEWTRDELLGYVATWSATVRLVETHGPARYERLAVALASVWPDGERRTITWPLTVRLARVP
jgi:SAM-dependent methyltransferase